MWGCVGVKIAIYIYNSYEMRVYVVSVVRDVKWGRVSVLGSLVCCGVLCV